MELQPNNTLEGIGNQKTLAFENYLVTRMDKAQNKIMSNFEMNEVKGFE